MHSATRSRIQSEPLFYVTLAAGCIITLLAQVYYIGWLAYAGSRLTDTAAMILGLPIIYMPWIAAYKVNSTRHVSGWISATFNLLAAGFGLFGYVQLLDARLDHSLSTFAFVVIPTYQAIIMVFFYLMTLKKDKRLQNGTSQPSR